MDTPVWRLGSHLSAQRSSFVQLVHKMSLVSLTLCTGRLQYDCATVKDALVQTKASRLSVCLLGVKGRRIRELTSVVQKRFKFPEGSVELYAEKVANRGLSAIAQAESLRYKLLGGLAVRRYVTPCS